MPENHYSVDEVDNIILQINSKLAEHKGRLDGHDTRLDNVRGDINKLNVDSHVHEDDNHRHDELYALLEHGHNGGTNPPPIEPDIPPPTTGITVPFNADAAWFGAQSNREFIFQAGQYPNVIGVLPRPGDYFWGPTRVIKGDRKDYSKDGTEISDWKVDESQPRTILTFPGGNTPAIHGAEDIRIVGIETEGWDSGYRNGQSHAQTGALGGGPGFRNGNLSHIACRDSIDGYGVRTDLGTELSNFVLTDNYGCGYAGKLGNGKIHHGYTKGNGKHGNAVWEAGNKTVYGNGAEYSYIWHEENAMAGEWPDIDNLDANIHHNVYLKNGLNGVKFEINGGGIITQNVARFNGSDQVPGITGYYTGLYNGDWPWAAQYLIQASGKWHGQNLPIMVTDNIAEFGQRDNCGQMGFGTIDQQNRDEHGTGSHRTGNVTMTGNIAIQHDGRRVFMQIGPSPNSPTLNDFAAHNEIVVV